MECTFQRWTLSTGSASTTFTDGAVDAASANSSRRLQPKIRRSVEKVWISNPCSLWEVVVGWAEGYVGRLGGRSGGERMHSLQSIPVYCIPPVYFDLEQASFQHHGTAECLVHIVCPLRKQFSYVCSNPCFVRDPHSLPELRFTVSAAQSLFPCSFRPGSDQHEFRCRR